VGTVRQRLFCAILCQRPNIYQDRLGEIVGKIERKGVSAGHIVLEYCEVLLHVENATCLRQTGFEKNGTVDRHIVGDSTADATASSGSRESSSSRDAAAATASNDRGAGIADGTAATGDLHTAFSWRGFRYVKVRVSGPPLEFRGGREDIYGRWSYVDLEETAQITFGGGDDQPEGDQAQQVGSSGSGSGDIASSSSASSEMLGFIVAMVKRTQRSNLVSGLPTDCPTREKHGWLGDAMGTAAEVRKTTRLFLHCLVRAFAKTGSG
jgi:hypothetical protein